MPLQCPHCQSAIVITGTPPRELVCPTCGSTIQVDPQATGGWLPSEAPKRLGKFELLEQLGVGSFGTVYKARDTELGRIVALKIPRAGSIPRQEDLDRFLREARSAAQLQHPGIVALYDAGQIDGTCYLVSEFIQGATLAERLSAGRLGFRPAAELLAEVALALHYAHEHGVIHRDIKPSNIMLDLEGRPHLMDFGLAKRATDEVTVTLEGQVLGTPAYMSPEQARGEVRKVDARSDVYSLGVILYELLTGELPFRGQTRMLLLQVMQEEPRPPRRLNDRIPRDLETICLKAMAKEPARRYPTANEVADDLRSFLKGEPIRARPVGTWERAWIWARRRPAVAALLAVSSVAALALVGLIVGSMYSTRLERALDDAEQARQEAEQARQEAVKQQQLAEQARDEARRYQYYHHIALAHAGWRDGDLAQMGPLLEDCPQERRHWEWHYLQRLRHGDLFTVSLQPSIVICVAFSPDGTRLAASGLHGMVKVLDAATGREVLTLKGHGNSAVWGLAFSPDGTRLASAAGQQIRVWDLPSGRELLVVDKATGYIPGVAFNRDGTQLVSTSILTATVWETATGRPLRTLKGHESQVRTVAFSPDGTQIASAGNDRTVRLWDAATGREVQTLRGHMAWVQKVAFSPDGTRLASASADRTVVVWDTRTGQALHTLRSHTGVVHSVSFSPEGSRLASAGVDQTVRLWDLATGREDLTLKGHSSEVLGVAFSPDGACLASGSADGTVKTWDTMIGPEARTLRGHEEVVWGGGLACSPDGRWIASAGADQTVRLCDAVTGTETRRLRGHEGRVTWLAFSPSGEWLASASMDRTVKLWETATGREVRTLKGHEPAVGCVAFSPDGTRLASSGGGTVRLWDVATGRELRTLQAGTKVPGGVAFSPDGKRLAACGGATAQVWDLATDQVLFTLRGHVGTVYDVAYSPDGACLATASDDNTLRIWDAATGQQLHKLDGHSGSTNAVAFNPDGRRLASASSDNTVRIWDTNTWREALTLRGHGGPTNRVAFSADGTRLVSASADGTVKVWDARPLTPEAGVEREALGLLEYLFARPLCKADVLEYLRTAPALRPPARELALALVERYREETDPERFHGSSWAVVRQPYLNAFQYRFALRQAETARRLAPDQGKYVTTLGAAHYRAGDYEKALQTLTEADQLNPGSPANLAFLAMAQHRLGQQEQAQTTRTRLRQALQQPAWAQDEEAQSFGREAAALVPASADDSER